MIAFEMQDVADIGRAPRIDRLVGVADNGQISRARRPRARQPVLHQVGVLEFVDEYVPVTILVALSRFRNRLEQLQNAQEKVVEVKTAVGAQ